MGKFSHKYKQKLRAITAISMFYILFAHFFDFLDITAPNTSVATYIPMNSL